MNRPGFLNRLEARLLDESLNLWLILANLLYWSAQAKKTLIVPAGFTTDFASVPRWPLIFWLAGDTARQAAVLHDYLYTTQPYPRKDCDRLFLEAMKSTGIPAWRCYPMYLAVRAGGIFYWKRKAKKDES